MFQTIGHKSGGFIQVSYNPRQSITAWSHGEVLGDHYQTVAGAAAAITRHHKSWVAKRTNDHLQFMRKAFV